MKEEFCSLCGKYRKESLKRLEIGVVSEGITCSIPACSTCHTFHHNLQRIWMDALKEYQRREKEKAIQMIKEKGGVLPDAFTQDSINR